MYDYIVIGAGSAGCVLANRLSANPKHRVALIEAGGKDTATAIHMPLGVGRTLSDPKLSWNLFSGDEPFAHNRNVFLPRGKVLGGSSSLNGMIYIRGQQEDFNTWAQLGCLGWGWDDLLPYFKKSEDFQHGESDLHGAGGELHVADIIHDNPTNHIMLKGFEEYGIPRNDDFNGHSQEGAGYYQVTIKDGKRCSTAVGFLKPARKRKNLDVLTGARVHKINIENGRAHSVTLARRGKIETLVAHQEIILSAGAYHSPHILHLSGIGDAAHLSSIGITPVLDRPEVGENLQDHYMAPMAFRIKSGVYSYNKELRGLNIAKNVIHYLLTRKGVMSIPAAQIGAFIKSDPALDRPDLQYHCLAITGDLETALDGKMNEVCKTPGLTIGGAMLRPESKGYARAVNADQNAKPHIVHNYLAEEEDRRLTILAMRMARDIVATPSLSDIIEEEDLPGMQAMSDDELLDFSKQYGTTLYHPIGTCRMGNDENAVVDPSLRLRGIDGLRVIDASIMPKLVSGNTNAATIAIAEKGADLILQSA